MKDGISAVRDNADVAVTMMETAKLALVLYLTG